MRNSRSIIGAVVVSTCVLAGLCVAQDAPLAVSEATRQTTSPFTAAQEREVTDYIQYHVGVMNNGTDEQVLTARRRLLEPLRPNPQASELFIRSYSSYLRIELAPLLRNGRSLVRLNAMIIAYDLVDPAVLDLALDGLTDEHVAVRYRAYRVAEALLGRGLSEFDQRRLFDAISRAIVNERDEHVWIMVLTILPKMDLDEAKQKLLVVLNRRVEAHARDLTLSLATERDALVKLYRDMVVGILQGTGRDAETMNKLMIVSYRYLALSANALTQATLDRDHQQDHQQMVESTDVILRWAVGTVAPGAVLPGRIDGLVKKQLWAEILAGCRTWSGLLIAPPINIAPEQIAVPGVESPQR